MKEKQFGPGLFYGNTKITIGIDQSLTGFALTFLDVNDHNAFSTFVYKSPYSGVQRLDDLSAYLTGSIHHYSQFGQYHDVAMEGTVLASQSALVLGELSATVKLALWDYFEPGSVLRTPLQIPPMTLKKYATGKGTAKKQEMLLQIYKRWGVEFNDDNAADSYALAKIAAGSPIGEIETKIQEQIKDPKYRDFIQ